MNIASSGYLCTEVSISSPQSIAMSNSPAFAGSIPRTYHDHLGPFLFEPYARDLAARLHSALAANAARDRAAPRILELAAGTGIVTRAIAASMPANATLLATDLSPAMLEVAKEAVAHSPHAARVTFQPVDACSLPFADASFDALACQYGVMFFPDKIGAMKHARRVLAPGGRYIFNVWDSLAHNPIPQVVHEFLVREFPSNPPQFLAQLPYSWHDRAEIERVTRAGGFANVALETVTFDSVGPSADSVARAWLEGTPLFPSLQERGVLDIAPLRRRVAEMLAAKFGEKPCRSTMRAIVVTAW